MRTTLLKQRGLFRFGMNICNKTAIILDLQNLKKQHALIFENTP